MSDLLTIILAAGKGTRMKSEKNKVLHKVAGKEMINHVINSASNISSGIVCIVGHQADQVKSIVKNDKVDFRLQTKQLGTAHAVIQAKEEIKNHTGDVLILYADIPLIQEETLKKMNEYHLEKAASLTILTAVLKNPTGYGRIIRYKQNEITNIVEEDDANIKQKKIDEINSGIMCVDSKLLNDALDNIDNNNAQNEYYLTDIVDYIKSDNKKILPFTIKDDKEIIGVNDRLGLSEAEKVLRTRINNKHMENGVTIIDPETTYIDEEVKIGSDTIIYPFSYIEGNTKIGKNNIIRPNNNII